MAQQEINGNQQLTNAISGYDPNGNFVSGYFRYASTIAIPDPDSITNITYDCTLQLYDSLDISCSAEGSYLAGETLYCSSPADGTVDYGYWGALTADNVKRFAKDNQIQLLVLSSTVQELFSQYTDQNASYAQANFTITITYDDGTVKQIYLGSTQVSKIYLGSTEVKKVYLCDNVNVSHNVGSTGMGITDGTGNIVTAYYYAGSTYIPAGLDKVTMTQSPSNFSPYFTYNSSTGQVSYRLYSTTSKGLVTGTIKFTRLLYSNG